MSLKGRRERFRMDFEQELVRADETTRAASFVIRPHSRRYQEVTRDGEVYFLDKFLKTLIPKDEIEKSILEQFGDLPVHTLSPSVDSMPAYANTRKEALLAELEGSSYLAPKEPADPHKDLPPDQEPKWLTFLSVDICGSTALRKSNRAGFDKALPIFLREMATLVGQFHGAILKITGDGFIAYIDHPSYTRQADNTIDLGLSFLVVLRDSINPALVRAGLPQLQIRVGADCGEATVSEFNVPTTGYSSFEVASDALNQAVKIQEAAEAGELLVGRSLYELLHVGWLERSTLAEARSHNLADRDYEVYFVS